MSQKYTYGQQLYTIKAARLLPFVPVKIETWHQEIWYQGPTGTGLVLTIKQTEAFDTPAAAIEHYQTSFIEAMKSLHEQAQSFTPKPL
jgi:hypothetical protein